MNSWKVILATMVIFGAGVVTGGLLVRHSQIIPPVHRPRATSPAHPPQPATAGGTRLDFLRRAQRELDLTPGQRERVDELLKDSQERTRQLMKPVSPLLREEVQQTRDKFLDLLTPEQRARFEELVKQQQHPPNQRRPQQLPPAGPAPEAPAPAP